MANHDGVQVNPLSVQVVGPGGVPQPDPPGRGRPSALIPLVAVLIVAAFGAGFLLARSGREFAPSIIEDGSTQPTTSTPGPTTTSTVDANGARLPGRTAGWSPAPLIAPATRIESYAIDGGRAVDVAVDGAGNVWWVSGTGVSRWNPTERSAEFFGEEVFGYSHPSLLAADNNVWVATSRAVFRFDGGWTRFPTPDSDEWVAAIEPLPDDDVAVLTFAPDAPRLYRSFAGDLQAAVVFDLPMPDVYQMTADRSGRLWLFGNPGSPTWIVDGTRLTAGPPIPAGLFVDSVAVADDLWVATSPGALLHLVDDAWARVSLPEAYPAERNPHQWVIAPRAGGGVWAVSVTTDGTALQVFAVDGSSTVAQPLYPSPNASVWSAAATPDGTLWLGTGNGLVGFDPVTGGWEGITSGSGPPGLLGSPGSMAIDGRGTLWAAAGMWNSARTGLVQSFDGVQWSEAAEIGSCPGEVGCWGEVVAGPSGDLWAYVVIGGDRALWHRSGDVWSNTSLPDPEFGGGDPAIAVGADGALWMVDSRSTASFNGGVWTVWDDGVVSDGSLVVGEDGTPWVIDTAGSSPRLMRFTGGAWAPAEPALPDGGWAILGRGPDDGMRVAIYGGLDPFGEGWRVWSFDGAAWELDLESDGWVAGIPPGPGHTTWVAGSDLWLVGDGPPRQVARGVDVWLTAGAPDGSLWALMDNGSVLLHVHPPD